VRHHAQVPASGVTPYIFSRTVRQYLRRRCAFIAGTERAKAALEYRGLAGEISGASGTIGGNNDPASGDGVFSQLWHNYYLTTPGASRACFTPPCSPALCYNHGLPLRLYNTLSGK